MNPRGNHETRDLVKVNSGGRQSGSQMPEYSWKPGGKGTGQPGAVMMSMENPRDRERQGHDEGFSTPPRPQPPTLQSAPKTGYKTSSSGPSGPSGPSGSRGYYDYMLDKTPMLGPSGEMIFPSEWGNTTMGRCPGYSTGPSQGSGDYTGSCTRTGSTRNQDEDRQKSSENSSLYLRHTNSGESQRVSKHRTTSSGTSTWTTTTSSAGWDSPGEGTSSNMTKRSLKPTATEDEDGRGWNTQQRGSTRPSETSDVNIQSGFITPSNQSAPVLSQMQVGASGSSYSHSECLSTPRDSSHTVGPQRRLGTSGSSTVQEASGLYRSDDRMLPEVTQTGSAGIQKNIPTVQ